MGVYLELVNYTKLFQDKKNEPIIVNNLDESTEEEKENFNKLIYTKYNSDLLSNLPTCECGEINGEYNIGIVCQQCNTPVVSKMDQELEPIIWIKAPIGVRALINPTVWSIITEHFTKSGFDIISWICDTNYRPTSNNVRIPAMMEEILSLGIERGFNNFVDNFDSVMFKLFNIKGMRQGVKKDELHPIEIMLKRFRDCIFSEYLPVPNRALLVLENASLGSYADNISAGAIDAIRTLCGIDNELAWHSVRTKENRTVKTISQLAQYYDMLAGNTLAKKGGVFRKHVFGTRCHFSFRGVITAITEAHNYDEIFIPWGIGISLLRIHLVNKLLRRGYTPNEAIALLNEHVEKFSPLLDNLFKELIAESPGGRLASTLQRNPSLERASAQAMFIPKVKQDPSDTTIGLSALALKGFNADKYCPTYW